MEEEKIVSLSALLRSVGVFFNQSKNFVFDGNSLNNQFQKILESFDHDVFRVTLGNLYPEKLENDNLKFLSSLISLSELLSSGGVSESSPLLNKYNPESGVVSIFEQVSLSGSWNFKGKAALLRHFPDKLAFDERIFPKERKEKKESLSDLLKGFLNELKVALDDFKAKGTLGSTLSVVEKYFWAIPTVIQGNTENENLSVSLFIQSKLTSAFALGLYRGYFKDKKDLNELNRVINDFRGNSKPSEDYPVLTLIHGDFSGIQSFITNISSKLAARSLKGRSAGLVLMQQFIAEHVLKNFGLDLQNLLYSGGGHFYIIAPFYKGVEEQIEKLKDDIDKALFEHFLGDIYLGIGVANITLLQLKENKISEIWINASESVNKDKSRKFSNLPFEKLFVPHGEGGLSEVCDICGKEDKALKTLKEEIKVCADCEGFIGLAGYLKEIQSKREKIIHVDKIKEMIPFLKHIDTIVTDKYALDFSEVYSVFPLPLGFPLENGGQIKEFDTLAKDANERTGTEYLGVFKADVDNLGNIFTRGLKNASFPLVSTLSRELSLFFEGYINSFISDKAFDKDIYLIYSGGDDTLAIGSWDKLIDFANKIYAKFREFTCYNNSITMSASIILVTPHSSVKNFLRESEERLETAKELSVKLEDGTVHSKGAINIFGRSLMWSGLKEENSSKEKRRVENEFENALKFADDLVDVVKRNGKIEDRSIIQRIKEISLFVDEKFQSEDLQREIPNIVSALWLLRYYWVRKFYESEKANIEELLYNDKMFNKINEILKREILYSKSNYELKSARLGDMLVGARIAELKTRIKNNQSKEE